MKKDSKCRVENALPYPLDRQGTLYVDGELHSTGVFDKSAGIYTWSAQYSAEVPDGDEIVLLADDGERIQIERMDHCPDGAGHHHFVTG